MILPIIIFSCSQKGEPGITASLLRGDVPGQLTGRAIHEHRRLWYRDLDGDGYGDAQVSSRAYTRPSGFSVRPYDCDDLHMDVHPGSVEVSTDGLDDDCDGQAAVTPVDELPTWEAVPTHISAELGVTMVTTDVTGDGMADLVLGGNQEDLDGITRHGTVTVYSGPLDSSGGPVDETDASAMLFGALDADTARVCSVGDLDDDGIEDLVIGSPVAGTGNSGFAYIARGPLTGNIDLTVDVQMYEGSIGEGLGVRCAGPGDVDGDGLPDVLLAAPELSGGDRKGSVYLLRGPAEQESLADADQIFAATDEGEYLGADLSALGDLTGDGTGDFAMSNAPDLFPDGHATYLITDFTPGTMHPSDVGITVHADYGHNVLSLTPNRVGDVDGDGYDDVGVGATESGRSDEFFILLGPSDTDADLDLLTEYDISLATVAGSNHPWLSFSTPLGDWNGDGTGALAIADAGYLPPSAPDAEHCGGGESRCQYGAVFVLAEPIWPGTYDLATQADRIEGTYEHGYMGGGWSGNAISGGADLNGDGAPDLAFSAWDAYGTASYTGVAYVLFGGGSL
jgi:hypothetical protein